MRSLLITCLLLISVNAHSQFSIKLDSSKFINNGKSIVFKAVIVNEASLENLEGELNAPEPNLNLIEANIQYSMNLKFKDKEIVKTGILMDLVSFANPWRYGKSLAFQTEGVYAIYSEYPIDVATIEVSIRGTDPLDQIVTCIFKQDLSNKWKAMETQYDESDILNSRSQYEGPGARGGGFSHNLTGWGTDFRLPDNKPEAEGILKLKIQVDDRGNVARITFLTRIGDSEAEKFYRDIIERNMKFYRIAAGDIPPNSEGIITLNLKTLK